MSLPNFNINPYIQPYMGNVNKELNELITQRRNDYEVAAETADVLGYQTDTLKQSVAPFEPDSYYAEELMGKYRGQIDQWSERGDYENLGREVKKASRQFAQEITPLMQRKKAYGDYKASLQERYEKGEIKSDVYQAALNKTKADNSAMTRDQVLQGQFSGFVPSKSVDVSKMLDDAIKGMESQGKVGKIQNNGDGTYTIVGGEYRTMQDIQQAAMRYLEGSSEFKSYTQTMNVLGLGEQLNKEILAGVAYVAGEINPRTNQPIGGKYRFLKDKSQQQVYPEWMYDRMTPVGSSLAIQDISSKNLHAKDKYEDLNYVDGKFVYGNYIGNVSTPEGTKRGYYYNEKTEDKLSPQAYINKTQEPLTKQIAEGADNSAVNYKFREASSVEEEEIQNKHITNLTNDSKKQFLVQQVTDNKVPEQWLNDPQKYQKQIDDYLRINEPRWNNPEYMKQTLENHKDAVKNAAVMNDNRVWTPIETRASMKRKGEELNIPNIIRTIGGRDVFELGADKESKREGVVDISSFLEETQKDGKLVDVTYNGLAQINPISGRPGQRYDFIYQDKDGKTFKRSVIVPVEDSALQPMQDVMSAAMAGNSTQIKADNVYIPSVGKNMNLTFDVISVPNPDKAMRKSVPFVGYVVITDAAGMKVAKTLSSFPEYYKSLVPLEVEKYLK
ncbi:MAG: hypothetical protein ACK52I_01295 [Pseudomonadota bacterium]|jgi:hypothetical protein